MKTLATLLAGAVLATAGATAASAGTAEQNEAKLARMLEERIDALAGIVEPPPAKIVAAPLHQDRGELVRIDRLEQRDVLVDQLLLEIDRVRRDDHALLLLHREVDRREEIGERLADAGARFHQQVLPLRQRARNGISHLELLRAELVPFAHAACDGAVGSEDVFQQCRQRRRL